MRAGGSMAAMEEVQGYADVEPIKVYNIDPNELESRFFGII